MALHKNLIIGDIHIPYQWEYANASARTGATGFVLSDIGKFSRQLDDNSVWMLIAVTPTWVALSGAVAPHASSHENGGGDEISVAGLSGELADAQTPKTHASSHHSGGGDALAHQSIVGAGTNAHSAIDTHLGSTSNPHSVTKSQVGLGNVTDDAQLKRASGDFATFTEKTSPVSADLILIEDSEASGAKKKIQAGNLTNNLFLSANMFDDFVCAVLDDFWTTSVIGTGSLVAVIGAKGGQVRIRAGNAAARSAELILGLVGVSASGFNPKFKIRAKADSVVTNAEFWFELVWIDASNYIYLRAVTGGNWILYAASGGTTTQVDTGIALDSSWHIFEVMAQSGQATAYIDGILRATITTNVPTGAGRPSVYIYASGAGGTKDLLVDAISFVSDRES